MGKRGGEKHLESWIVVRLRGAYHHMRRPVNCLVKGVKRRESWCSGPIAWLSELRSHTLSWVSRGSPTTNMHTHFYMDSHTSATTHSTHSIQQHTLTYNWWCTHSNKTQPKHTLPTHTHSQAHTPNTHLCGESSKR